VIQASLAYAISEPGGVRTLVEGPAGQVAISYTVSDALFYSKIRLFTSSQLLAPPAPPRPSWPIAASSTADGQVLDIGIVHNSLVYDSGRNVYYASVPGSVIGAGNSIATISPATGQVTHSVPIGSEPNQLALAADGSVLYVGLDGSNEVLRLALPSMSAQGRVHLITHSFFGRTRAESVAVSPVDSSVAAVAMAWVNFFDPHHAGDALLRDMVLQPNRTPVHTGSNLITFNSTGDKVYGMNAEAEDGLRRLGVLADGLVEELKVVVASTGILPRVVSFANGQVVEGGTVFDAPALTAAGTVPGVQDCWPTRRGTGLLCLNWQSGRVLVADSTTFAIGASLLFYPNGEPDFAKRLVQGPAGQIGVSYIPNQFFPPSIRLFTSALLP
jgi:DNA-binding beta-propeller fold protein YncE